jgi:hypothetical protein
MNIPARQEWDAQTIFLSYFVSMCHVGTHGLGQMPDASDNDDSNPAPVWEQINTWADHVHQQMLP